MRESRPDLHMIQARIERTKAHGARQVLDRYVRLAAISSHPAAEIPARRQVWIEHVRPIEEGDGAIEVADEKAKRMSGPCERSRAEDIAPAFAALKGQADALYVAVDQLVVANLTHILTLALGARLPTIFSTRDFVKAGALTSYGPSYSDLFRHSADYVDKILRGMKPGDIPVEQPTKFELVINLSTAKALGLTIPESFLLRADEVIE
jgi:ABC transporter substrate binding protein